MMPTTSSFRALSKSASILLIFRGLKYLVNSYHQGIVHDVVSLQKEGIVKDRSSEKLFGMLHNMSR